MRWYHPILLALLFPVALAGQAEPGSPDVLRVAGHPVELTLTPVSAHTLRITVVPTTPIPDLVPVEDGRVLLDREWPAPLFRGSRVAGERLVSHGNLRIRVTPAPLTLDVTTAAGEPVQRLVLDDSDGSVRFRLGDRPVFGLGNGGQTFDRRGSYFTMQRGHRHGEYLVYGARTPVPLLIGTAGWSLFFHRPYNGHFDLRTDEGRFLPAGGGYFPQREQLVRSSGLEARKEAPLPLDLFLTHVDRPDRALAEYTTYTGRPAMPPKWALGYMQSHRNLSVGGPREVMQVARTFREKRLPVDALIYLGTGFTAGGWNTGHGQFEFHPQTFDRPEAMLDEMRALNYNVVLHVTEPPLTLGGTLPPAPGEGVGEDHVARYWDRHRGVFAMGVAGWWPDMGDQLDNDARLARHYVYYHGPLQDRPDERPWSLHRTGFAGMHRYGGWIWSGDVNGAWQTLEAHIPVGINASLSTSPFWGTDIGGFYPTEEYTGELFIRWFQFGAFTPSFRSHGVTWRTRIPWGWNPGEMGPLHTLEYLRTGSLAADTVPMEYRDVHLHDPRVEPIVKQFLELRYQLMPYLYSAVREAHDTGMPIMRALWLHYPDDPAAVARSHEYLWGRDMLIAPVFSKGTTGPIHGFTLRELYLPDGVWYDFWRPDRPIAGRQTLTQTVALDRIPIFVRAGAILPLDPVRQYVDEPVTEPTTIRVYPGADGEFRLYQDDGRSMAYLEGQGGWIRLTWDDAARVLTLEPEGAPPAPRRFHVLLATEREPRSVEFTGDPVQLRWAP
jgi:alpha-glucosidase (family GH31 glycosyl hydrolase)